LKHIGKIAGLALSAVMALTMTAPAFASDYSFTTTALQDYYNSTSYEDVYGSQYNYGGRNVVDYDIPELEYGRMSTTMTGVMERTILPGLQQVVASTDGSGYGLGGENGGGGGPLTELVLDDGTGAGSGSTVPVIPDTPQITVPNSPAYTSVQGMAYKDGSIGTLKIAKLGISVKVWEGESTTSMAKGVGHYSSTSAWDGNVGLAGHNRGAKYNIGTIKNLVAGDTITYTTMYGTRTYQVTSVKTITNTDWSYLQGTADNRITITTCLENHPESRVCVQAVEVK
jgi:LPXTG-site transpeptidase (sortase) family protein